MGHIALGLEKLLAPGSQGFWMILDKKSWKEKFRLPVCSSVVDSAEPPVLREGKVESGFLFTNDPGSSSKFQSGLYVRKV